LRLETPKKSCRKWKKLYVGMSAARRDAISLELNGKEFQFQTIYARPTTTCNRRRTSSVRVIKFLKLSEISSL
jgi:hypothetical protein